MKKIIFFSTILSLVLWGLTPALAESEKANDKAVKPISREVVVDGDLATMINPTTLPELTLKLTRIVPKADKRIVNYPAVGATLTVKTTEKTKIVRKYLGKADWSELAIGDKLQVVGKMDEKGVVTAQLIKDNSVQITFSAQKGAVVSVDTAANIFVMKKGAKEVTEFKVFVTANTKFSKWGVEKPTLADLKAGSEVNVRGVVRQAANEITADSVVIKVSEEEKETSRSEAKKATLIKKYEQMIEKVKQELANLEKKLTELKAVK